MKMFVALASMALVAAPAFAQSGGTPAGNGSSEPATQNGTASSGNSGQNANGERLICRRVEGGGAVGRMGSRRVCQTAAQWREGQRDDQ